MDVRNFWFIVALPALAYGQVEGMVTSSTTHAALAGVGVSITAATGHGPTYTATTDADGRFHISTIEQDGEYRAEFVKHGFRQDTVRTFRFAAASGGARVNIELTPLPVVRGRVLDGEGRPAPKVRVELVSATGNWTLATMTGPDGGFVFQEALPSPAFIMRAIPLRTLPAPEPLVWAPTYYPDGTDRSQAARIVWSGDGDLEGYQIRLRATPVYHVRGTVLDDAGKPAFGVQVELVPVDLQAPVMLFLDSPAAQTKSDENGAFDLPKTWPGEWLVVANSERGGKRLIGTAEGRVSTSDWDTAKIRLRAPFAVKGLSEGPDGGHPRGSVMLAPEGEFSPPGTAVVNVQPDGQFEFSNVYPGRYRISPNGGGSRIYLSSIQFGGREVLGQVVDIQDGTLPIRVAYQANGGSVRGAVEHCKVVMVFPTDAALRSSAFTRSARWDDAGRFQADNLRPGDYYAVAMGLPPSMALEQVLDQVLFDPSRMGEFAGGAEIVRVEGGQSTTVELKLSAWPER